jgi:hypothetical protein
MIIERLVKPWEREDEFDALPFGEIPSLARLQQLLEQLGEQGVGVIAGKYVRHSLVKTKNLNPLFSTYKPIPGKPKWAIKVEFILCLQLVPAEKQEGDVKIRLGKSLDRLMEIARDLPDDDKEGGTERGSKS